MKFNANQIQVGISACLVGEKVRFDGGHKQSRFCVDELSQYVSYQKVCPEMAIGMGTPRQTIRLVDHGKGIRLQASRGHQDYTDKMLEFSRNFVKNLSHLSGYVVCAKSPTCGMERVKVYQPQHNMASRDGIGLYTKALMEANPLLPVEEDGRLNDPVIRENFITRVFTYHHWQQLVEKGITRKALFQFHANHKYLLMAHEPKMYRELGPLLATFEGDVNELAQQYITGVMAVLKHNAKRRNHANSLQHIQGYFKRNLSSIERRQLAESIDKYRQGLLPLLAPITLIKLFLERYPDPYIAAQVYLNPHPEQLKLRISH
ncbi:hypothetical protein GCM10007895_22720 [Paraferrimonas sedimenticola]|uniref:DUF1722 domain-containing protein n=2 Tax=Paraferrimonas sedimenticola TaxID=375674 RepID=A0AA37RX24_9GAMM|nr:hypothetical protein GCM10007895_22720 [Paraferrimonas sedimenticola]